MPGLLVARHFITNSTIHPRSAEVQQTIAAIDDNEELTPAQRAAAKRKLEDENKSWLQKNWMMLVPAGLIVSSRASGGVWGGGHRVGNEDHSQRTGLGGDLLLPRSILRVGYPNDLGIGPVGKQYRSVHTGAPKPLPTVPIPVVVGLGSCFEFVHAFANAV